MTRAAKTATRPKTTDPHQARRELIDRLLARRPEPYTRTYPNAGPRGQDFTVTAPADEDRLAPKDLGEWVDDRIHAVLGSRVVLNPGEQAYLDVCEAIRGSQAEPVRAALRAAASGLSDLQGPALFQTLEGLRGKARGFAYDLTNTALGEARRLGMDQVPRRLRRHVTIAGRDD